MPEDIGAERLPLFCGTALAERIERVEVQLVAKGSEATRRRRADASARLADAAAAGCDVAVITTQPGSKSQQNAQRQGFDLLYTRAVLVKQP